MGKHKLTEEEKKELTQIALHEGYNKAFLKLLDIAVDPKSVEEITDGSQSIKTKYDLNVEGFLKDIGWTKEQYIKIFSEYAELSNDIAIYESDGTYPEKYEVAQDMFRRQTQLDQNVIPNVKVFDCIQTFDFVALQKELIILDRKNISLDSLLMDALYAVVNASCLEEDEGTYFVYGFFIGIRCENSIKLVYMLEESTNDW